MFNNQYTLVYTNIIIRSFNNQFNFLEASPIPTRTQVFSLFGLCKYKNLTKMQMNETLQYLKGKIVIECEFSDAHDLLNAVNSQQKGFDV